MLYPAKIRLLSWHDLLIKWNICCILLGRSMSSLFYINFADAKSIQRKKVLPNTGQLGKISINQISAITNEE
jgi:hypothetical protein